MSSSGRLTLELSEKKRALLASLLREKGVEAVTQQRIVRRTRTNSYPLSFAQQRLWFLDQLEPGNSFYNVPAAVRLRGHLDVPALKSSFAKVVGRHESLRTSFHVVDGQPVQVVATSPEAAMPFIDLSALPDEEREIEARRLATEETERSFDLATGPLVRARLLRLSAREHVVVLTMHHIACDAWSMEILVKEISALYDAFSHGWPSPLAELPIQYADYAHWQRGWLRGEVLDAELAYWTRQLKGAAMLELPTDRPRPAVQTYLGASRSFELPAKVAGALKVLGRQTGTTAFMTTLAAFKALLARYTNQTDIIVGTPVANRGQAETEGLIGFFLNTLVLRTDLSGDPTFRELVGRVREAALGAYSHQEVPFEKLVEELRPRRDPSRSPLFQVMFVLESMAQADHRRTQTLPGLTMSRFPVGGATAKFDLTLLITESPDDWSCRIEYNTNLFEAQTIDRLIAHFRRLLGGAVAQPELRLSELTLLSGAERRQLLSEWSDGGNSAASRGTRRVCLHELVEGQVGRTPDAVAVVFEEQQLTFAQLDARANQLARHLRRLGVGPDSVVAVCVERSIEMVVALLGILKAGAAYLPLDPSHPKNRLAFTVADAGAAIVLTQEWLRHDLPAPGSRILCLDADWQSVAVESAEPTRFAVTPDNLAYVIYTSGSTGAPKGVMVTHRAISNHMLWMHERFPLSETDCVLQKTPFTFDASVWEFFLPLMSGARLVLARPGGHLDGVYLLEKINEWGVTILQMVPTMMRVLLGEEGAARCPSLRRVFCGGESLTTDLRERFHKLLEAELYNLYGPTEAAIDATYWHSDPSIDERLVPIGRPITNTQVFILDEQSQPTPVGVAGELYIGGEGLARGYLKRPGLTAERFVPHLFAEEAGARLYRTGDLVRYRHDGNIEFLGRVDHQVKIRGFRVELGEVESVLGQHPSVRDAVVVVREDVPGDLRLVTYVVCEPGHESSRSEWRKHLAERLPDYMIPSHFVTLGELPVTANGKVDRRSLPAPAQSRPELAAAYEPPRDAAEELVARVWSEVLGVERVGVNDNFFDLGGHSLSATRVVFRLREAFRTDLPLRALFESPTPGGLADALARAWGERGIVEEIARTNLELEQLSDDEAKALIEAQDSYK